MVRSDFHAALDRWIGTEVLLFGTQATILDRGPSLDDAGDRRGPTLGRLPKGISHERARCLRRHSAVRDTADSWSLSPEVWTEPLGRMDNGVAPREAGEVLLTGY